jgi:hypothetical protein
VTSGANSWQALKEIILFSKQISLNSGTTGTTSGSGTAYPSGAPEVTQIYSGVRVTRSLVLCSCFVDRCIFLRPQIYTSSYALKNSYNRILHRKLETEQEEFEDTRGAIRICKSFITYCLVYLCGNIVVRPSIDSPTYTFLRTISCLVKRILVTVTLFTLSN